MKIALLFLTAAILLHLYVFNNIPLQFDELLMYDVLKRYDVLGLIPFLYAEEIQQPLGYLLVKFFMTFIDDTTAMMRLPALLATLLLPWATYKLGRLTFDKEDSLKLATILLLFLPVVMYSGSMRPYVLFLLCSVFAFYQVLLPQRKSKFLVGSFILLFFVHPFGSLITLVMSGIYLSQRKEGTHLFRALLLITVIMGIIGGLFRHEELRHLVTGFTGLSDYFRALYNFSFLLSGREFSSLLAFLILAVAWRKYVKKDVIFKLHKLWGHLFVWSGAGALVLTLFFGKHLYPRHFIFLLPGIAILLLKLINAVSQRTSVRHALFILGSILLTYKTIGKEAIHKKPFEIDSSGLAMKAKDLSQNVTTIASCGNCFSYYIKENHLCLGRSLPPKAFADYQEVIYLELDYVTDTCGVKRITEKNTIAETYSFVGGKVHRILFEQ